MFYYKDDYGKFQNQSIIYVIFIKNFLYIGY